MSKSGKSKRNVFTEQNATGPIRYFLPVLVLIILLLIWFLITYINLFPAYALPSPGSVWKSFQEEIRAGRLINDIIASLWRVAVGFVISVILGIPAGLWLGQHLHARQAFVPMLNFFGSSPRWHGYHLQYSGFISETNPQYF